MTKYIASVKYEGKIQIMEKEYSSMKQFKKDLRANGYQVRFICLPENFDQACEDYFYKLETKRYVNKAIRAANKKF